MTNPASTAPTSPSGTVRAAISGAMQITPVHNSAR